MIEITPKHIQAMENSIILDDEYLDFERRQTLKSCQRYTSPYLEKLQDKLLTAREQLAQEEFSVLQDLQKEIS